MGLRRQGREFALQSLYLVDIVPVDKEKALAGLTRGENLEPKAVKFAQHLIDGTLQNKTQLDELIVRYSENWELNRMAALDRNILRLGTFELLFDLETPVSVIIDEAVEMAKQYSTHDSGKFVNGILDKIKNERKNQGQHGNGNETKS